MVSLRIPALRERVEDIPALCEHFLAQSANPAAPRQFEPAALERLMSYAWPGNVRELENAVLRASMLADGDRIRVEHLPGPLQTGVLAGSLTEVARSTRRRVEREAVLAALRAAEGNRAKAARLLKISRSSLYNRLRDLQIDES